MLGKARHGDPRLVQDVRKALLAHPEIHVVKGAPAGPDQIEVWQTSYGGKVFSRESAPGQFAVLARCFDAGSCLSLAAMVRAAVPWSEPVLSCGDPPAVSGGRQPLDVTKSMEGHVQDP